MKIDLLELTLKYKLQPSFFKFYLDSCSNEFGRRTIQQNLDSVAKLILCGEDFNVIVDECIESDPEVRMPIVRSTLLDYFVILKNNNPKYSLVSKYIRTLSDKQIIDEFIASVKEYYADKFSFDKLILSYVQGDEATYKAQVVFFRIDFNVNIDEKLEQRFLNEGYDLTNPAHGHWRYTFLYKYMVSQVFIDLANNAISYKGQDLIMPMSKAILKLIHKHYPLAIHERLDNDAAFRHLAILGFAKDLVKILYF